jgi:hypothetical protein
MFRALGVLALTAWLGCAHRQPADVEPTEPDRPSLPRDVTPQMWNESLKPLVKLLGDCRGRQREPAGRIEVQIDVGIDGTPGSIIAYGSGAGREMRECIASTFVGAHFPRSERGGYRYRYPIVFH